MYLSPKILRDRKSDQRGVNGSQLKNLAIGKIGLVPKYTPNPRVRDGTRGCGCGFGKNPPAGKPAGLGKTRPTVDPRVHFCTRTRTRWVSSGFRVSADLTIAIIRITIQHSNKMKLTINHNSA